MRPGYLREQLRALPSVACFLVVGSGLFLLPKIMLPVIAIGLLLLALAVLYGDYRLARSGRRAQGTVVDHEQEEEGLFPVVEFHDATGRLRRERTRQGTGARTPAVGSRVVLLYDPAGANGCELDTAWRRWGFALLLILFASVFALGAMCGK